MSGADLNPDQTLPEGAGAFTLDAEPSVGDMPCPHCNSASFRRSSGLITLTFRKIFYQCRNVACGHSWVASLSYDYGLSPSAIPNPKLDLPLRPVDREKACARDGPDPDPNQFLLFD